MTSILPFYVSSKCNTMIILYVYPLPFWQETLSPLVLMKRIKTDGFLLSKETLVVYLVSETWLVN